MTPKSLRTSATLACVLLTPVACEDNPPLRYETKHLLIGTYEDSPLCRGDLDHYERIITELETQLATSVEDPIEVYIWFHDDPGWCASDVAIGCYRNGVVYSGPTSIGHELAHAVIDKIGDPAPFWNEGAAEAVQTDRTIFGGSAPSSSLELETQHVGYTTVGHFSRWLIETRGIELYRKVIRSQKNAREAFESVYGMDFDDAEAQYFNEAPYSYGSLIGCEPPELPSTGALEWSEDLQIDCDTKHVRATPDGVGIFRTLTIEQYGHYEISTSAEIGTIARCNDENLEEPVLLGDPEYGDVPPVTMNFIYQYARAFGADGEPTVLKLAPGKYEIGVGFEGHDPHTARLEVQAAPGPIPGLPEPSP